MTRVEGDEPRWVCFDVGETLIQEGRIWAAWAAELPSRLEEVWDRSVPPESR